MRRRRRRQDLGSVREGFLWALEPVERAKEAIVAGVPSARSPGRPLAEALAEFDEELREAGARMPDWRHQELGKEWESCRDGLEEALRRAEALRLDAPELGFETLLTTVGDLIAPLEAFEAAAEALRQLRARRVDWQGQP